MTTDTKNEPVYISVQEGVLDTWKDMAERVANPTVRYKSDPLKMANEAIRESREIGKQLLGQMGMQGVQGVLDVMSGGLVDDDTTAD